MKTYKKIRYFTLIILLIFTLNSIVVFNYGFAFREEKVPGFGKKDQIRAGENVLYNFSNNNMVYQIHTDSNINLNIQIGSQIQNRQIYLDFLNNNNSFQLNISTQKNLQDFEIMNQPKGPSQGRYKWQLQYNCIYRLKVNSTIQTVIVRFNKSTKYGLNPDNHYSIATYNKNQDSWDLIHTDVITNSSTGTTYLEAQIVNLTSTSNTYLTVFEGTLPSTNWFWIPIVISIVSIIGIIILISKKDYFSYLLKRSTPVDKGAHRLTMEEVLENENRNKIIEIILEEPGIHYNDLLRKTDLAAGNLAWHLDVLETYKVIGKKRVGKYLVYFPYYQKNPISNLDLKLQKSELTLKVLEMIEEDPGIYNKIITDKLKVDHKTIHYHIKKLLNLGLVHTKKSGRKKKLYPNLEAEYYNNNSD
ncbi:MAG: winged helix-turn-helix transcriptional regulator [Candidatus Lokiarchaeota archaeon]